MNKNSKLSMTKYFPLLLLIALPFLSGAQAGTLRGNAFWKYNDFMGTRPDAGDIAYIFPYKSDNCPIITKCDGAGNFQLDTLTEGKYLVVIQSKNTFTKRRVAFDALPLSSLENYYRLDFSRVDSSRFNKIVRLSDAYMRVELEKGEGRSYHKAKPYLKQMESIRKEREQLIAELMAEVKIDPLCISFLLNLRQRSSPKLFAQEVNVRAGQTSTVVADFGLTDILF